MAKKAARKQNADATVQLNAEKLRLIAARIRVYAQMYENAAETLGNGTIEATGMTSLEDKVFSLLRGNTASITKAVMKVADQGAMERVAEPYVDYTVNDANSN